MPDITVQTPTDQGELVRKLLADIKSELVAGKAIVKETETTPAPLPADLDVKLQKMIADALEAKRLEDEAKALKALDKTGLEHKGEFTTKGGIPGLSYKSMIEFPAPTSDIKELQSLNDQVYLASCLLGTPDNPRDPRTFQSERGKMLVAQLQRKANALYSTGAGYGDEWVPTGFSDQLYTTIEAFGLLEPQFPKFQMPTNPYTFPVKSARSRAYLAVEPTDAASTKLVASNLTTADQSFSAACLAVRQVWSYVFDEDSVIPALPTVLEDSARALSFWTEQALLNGDDTSGSHIDTYDEWNSNAAIASNDARKAFDGLRYIGLRVEDAAGNATKTTMGASAITASRMNVCRSAMGKFAARMTELLWVMGPRIWIQAFRMTGVRTIQDYGDRATIRTGQLGDFEGIPIIVSECMCETQNTSGVYATSSNTYASAVLANVQCFKIGEARGITVERAKDIETQQHIVVATRRLDFKPMGYDYATPTHGDTPCNVLYDIDTASTT